MGVGGRATMEVVSGTVTTMGTLSWEACGSRTIGTGWLVSVEVDVMVERAGIGGNTCCRRTLSIMVVEGGAWDRRHVWIKKG